MSELWAWMVEEEPGVWNLIAAVLPAMPDLGVIPLVTSGEEVAQEMVKLATAHGDASGKPVRLVHYVEADE